MSPWVIVFVLLCECVSMRMSRSSTGTIHASQCVSRVSRRNTAGAIREFAPSKQL
jgi:hypothetical protein